MIKIKLKTIHNSHNRLLTFQDPFNQCCEENLLPVLTNDTAKDETCTEGFSFNETISACEDIDEVFILHELCNYVTLTDQNQ